VRSCYIIWTAPKFENAEHLHYPEPDSGAVNPSDEATRLVRKSSASPTIRGQPHQPSTSSDAHATHDDSSFQRATREELDHPTSQQITHERNTSLNGLPSQSMDVNDKPRCVPLEDDDDSDGSTEQFVNLVTPNTSSEEEIAQLEHQRIADLERQLSETLAMQTERDRHITQLTDQLVQKGTLLEQAEANAMEAKKRAGLEQRELQAKLDELMLSHSQALEQAQSASRKATFRTTEANERSQQELAEVHTKLKARESELTAVRLRLTDADDGWAKSKAEAETLRAGTHTAAGLVNMDVDCVMRLMERLQSVEAEMALLRGDEKSIEEMKCRNEG
jgi:DNA repair exonuclease SbcCD ATPase subunit